MVRHFSQGFVGFRVGRLTFAVVGPGVSVKTTTSVRFKHSVFGVCSGREAPQMQRASSPPKSRQPTSQTRREKGTWATESADGLQGCQASTFSRSPTPAVPNPQSSKPSPPPPWWRPGPRRTVPPRQWTSDLSYRFLGFTAHLKSMRLEKGMWPQSPKYVKRKPQSIKSQTACWRRASELLSSTPTNNTSWNS